MLLDLLKQDEEVTAALMVTRLLRLQQITCGYVPADADGQLHRFPTNARLAALLDAQWVDVCSLPAHS